jgi:Carboxypeptidase regulatory-like domain
MNQKTVFAGLIAMMLAAANASVALCAEVSGTVTDATGAVVAKVRLSATDSSGKSAGNALTDVQGKYRIAGLSPGTYVFVLDPLSSGFKGGNGLAQLNEKGLTIDWKISAASPALALARQDASEALAGDPFGFTAAEFAGLVGAAGGVITSGVVGGMAAAGGFSGASASPSF